MIKKHIYELLFIVMSCVVLFSCTQERSPCFTPKVASFNLEFVHHVSDTSTVPTDTLLPHAVFGAVGGINNTLTVYTTQQSLFTISLSPLADSCRWLFTTDSLKHAVDTLSFSYTRQLSFLSNACGYTYFYHLTDVKSTHFNIDSVLIINTSITNDVKPTHLKIYIHPDF